MAESDTILQLGIEAAREGNRDEARNLFTLLTRQEPNNLQAWLWLAGVAESPDERRAALEKVLELDPKNEMAVKGLEAMGYTPGAPAAPVVETAAVAAEPVSSTPPPAARQYDDMTDEERYAAELDAAYETYDEVERAPSPVTSSSASAESAATGSAAAASGSSASRDDRVRTTPRRSSVRVQETSRAVVTSGPSSLMWWLLGGLALLAVLFAVFLFMGGGNQPSVANGPTAPAGQATTVATGQTSVAGGGEATAVPGQPTADPNAPPPTADPNAPPPTADPNAPAPTADPNAPAQPAPPANYPDPATANPSVTAPDTFLEVNGVAYAYGGRSLCPVSCSANLGKQVGSFTAQGTYVLVLTLVGNRTGQTQTIAPDFFVLKDDQGRVYNALPQVSSAYRAGGGIADFSLEDPIPAGLARTSVPLIFDVAPDATGLVLFTRPKQDQGWRVL